MMHALLLLGISAGAIFELHSIPLEETAAPGEASPALTFFADADNDKVGDLFILEGTKLTVIGRDGAFQETLLPHGVSVFDIADTDGNGASEVIAVQRRAIFRIPFAVQGATIQADRLFDADSLYATAYNGPMPTVLVVNASGERQIALPTASGIDYRALDGTLINQTPYANTSTAFTADSHEIESSSEGSDLRVRYRSVTELEISAQSDSASVNRGFGNATDDQETTAHPWFLVHRGESQSTRAIWHVDDMLNTVIRIADVTTTPENVAAMPVVPGPERRYPGALVTTENVPPDFDGDGYADILLWNAPRPGISVDSLLRAVTGRNWPLTLTAHLYSPEKGRFEPVAATSFEFRIPVTWFLAGDGPLRHQVLRDFNGDGKTDLGMCTQENEFGVWLYNDGFHAAPDEKHSFPEGITGIEHAIDISGDGKTSIVLRGNKRVYALYAQ